MEFNRNHYFMAGILLLFLGIQFRMVESVVLNDRVGHFLDEHSSEGGETTPILAAIGPRPPHKFHPPTWLGWALLSSGSVLVLHSMAMKKPGG